MTASRRLLVIGAHSGDFVWRSAGTIARTIACGGDATVVALSYGERGESGELWKEPGQTVENVKRVRDLEAQNAADELNAIFRCLDLGDYPLTVRPEDIEHLAEIIRTEAPDVLLTHAEKDPFNPDHPTAFEAVRLARLLASGAGVASAFERVKPPVLLAFEPHQPELCAFIPNVFVDITDVFAAKVRAMECSRAQSYLIDYYTDLAARRANHARRISGNGKIKHAEAFQRFTPEVVDQL